MKWVTKNQKTVIWKSDRWHRWRASHPFFRVKGLLEKISEKFFSKRLSCQRWWLVVVRLPILEHWIKYRGISQPVDGSLAHAVSRCCRWHWYQGKCIMQQCGQFCYCQDNGILSGSTGLAPFDKFSGHVRCPQGQARIPAARLLDVWWALWTC